MAAEEIKDKGVFSLLSAKGALLNVGWNLGSPSVVLSYMAIAHDVPVLLAGLLFTIRRSANMCVDFFGASFIESRQNRAVTVAATEIALAVCLLLAIGGLITGSPMVTTVALVLSMVGLGLASELQNILFNDYIGVSLASDKRTRMKYWAIGLGGAGTILLIWPLHLLMLDAAPLERHTTIVLLGIGCFFASAYLMVGVSRRMPYIIERQATGHPRRSRWKQELAHLAENYRRLSTANWFRNFMTVRIMLQSVELSLPFFAILAALSSGASARGVTALIISSALAYCVSGPLWRAVSLESKRAVMITGCVMGASAGLMLVGNHFMGYPVNTIYLHSAALFMVTVAAEGVTSARSLYFLDIAPASDRISGLTVSKSLVRVAAVAASAGLAALAHMQHVVWAILAIALLNVLTAAICFALVKEEPQTIAAE